MTSRAVMADNMRLFGALRRPPNVAAAVLIAAALAIASTVAWQQRRAPPLALPPGTIGAVDSPVAEAAIGTSMHVAGWALDPAGLRGIEIRVDGRAYPARYGISRRDVAEIKRGYPDSA